ncbi:hypothetical protein SAMN02799631_02020 [Methylobacterium sp. 174MFSha1.1]|nr:hypothetical protein [Methylobacterium sp. 174MFSha1.1]SFU73058.1 hypothetical protein SAMN02799631_02020 [Methylobacterium sp. 174MFSha1.1]
MRALLAEPGEWTRDRERRQGELFGYENWQNDVWLSRWQRPAPL